MAELTPRAKARGTTATAVNPGDFLRTRRAKRTSARRLFVGGQGDVCPIYTLPPAKLQNILADGAKRTSNGKSTICCVLHTACRSEFIPDATDVRREARPTTVSTASAPWSARAGEEVLSG